MTDKRFTFSSEPRRFLDPHLARRLEYQFLEYQRLNGGELGWYFVLHAGHHFGVFLFTGYWEHRRLSWQLSSAGLVWLNQLETRGTS